MEANINTNSGSNVHPIRPPKSPGSEVGVERESWKGMAENLYRDMSALWGKESELIRTEMNEKISDAKAGVVSLVSGGVVLFVGLICVAATAIIGLSNFMPLWLSAVIVTAAFLVIGGIMLGTAKKKLEAEKLKPRRSVEAFGEIQSTIKERINEVRTTH